MPAEWRIREKRQQRRITVSRKQQAAKDLNDALSDLADIFGKKFRANMMPEQEQKPFPVMVRVFDAAFRLGYHSFKDAARFVLQTIREKIGAEVADAVTIDHLQGAYIAMSGGKELATAKRDVVSVESKPNWSKEMSLTSVAAPIWNEIARTQPLKTEWARKAFAMDQAEMAALEDREYQALKRRVAPVVASAFLDLKPLLIERRAITRFYVGAPGVSPGASGDSVSQRGGDLRIDGPPIEPDAAKVLARLLQADLT